MLRALVAARKGYLRMICTYARIRTYTRACTRVRAYITHTHLILPTHFRAGYDRCVPAEARCETA